MTAKTMNFQIPAELARTEAIAAAQPERFAPLRKVAKALSRRGLAAAKVELVNLALLELVNLVFEDDTDGRPANVDPDGRILIPLPWGRLGHKQWELRRTEANALRWLMLQRYAVQNEPLFVYDAGGRVWLVNLAYGKRSALSYLRTMPVTLAEWRQAWEVTTTTWARQNMGRLDPVRNLSSE